MKGPSMRIGARRITASPGHPMFWQKQLREKKRVTDPRAAEAMQVSAEILRDGDNPMFWQRERVRRRRGGS